MKSRFIYRLIGLVICLHLVMHGNAQQIVHFEYFFDTIPQSGQGTIIPITPTNSFSGNLTISTAGLQAGKHLLYIRALDSNNNYSLYYANWIFVESPLLFEADAWEWYTDADPGQGQANIQTFTPVDSLQSSLVIQTDSLPAGGHHLQIRIRSSPGIWSHYYTTHLAIEPDSSSLMLTGLEYFIGPDPGTGNAAQIGLSPAPAIDLDVTALTDTLALGNYMLGMRARNEIGVWSHVFSRPFAICTMFGPKAGFDWNVERNRVYFINHSEYIQQAEWAFGDGNSDTLQLNPAHNYIPGVYNVCMIAKNVCGRDTMCREVVVRGVARITPTVHANEGVLVSDIYGGGLDSGSTIRLIKDGVPDIVATTPNFLDHTQMRPVFKFRGDPVGTYHLVVDAPLGRSDTLYNAITLQLSTGHGLWLDMAGPSRLLINRKVAMTVLVGNKGNNAAYGVPLYIKAPVSSKLSVEGNLHQDSLPQFIYDSFPHFSVFEDPFTNDTTMFGAFVLHMVRPGEVKSFTFTYQPTAIGQEEIIYYLSKPMVEDWQLDSLFRSSCTGLPICAQCALDILGVIPGVGCAVGAFDLGCAIGNAAKGKGKALDLIGSLGGAILSCTPSPAGLALALAKEAAGAASGLSGASSSCGPGGCNPKPKNPKPINTVGSWDPNIKIGPTGFTTDNYTRGDHPFVYTTYFENADTATAPANEVWVIDTLDKALFDLSTLQFISFGFGDTSMTVLESIDPASFVRDIDLRPARNTIVRIQGSLDTASGVLTAYYASYDPDTMRLVYDPLDGFLPPNVIAPEGEGFIQFMVSLKPGIQHLDRIENEAAIYFDANAPIVTPVWVNTIDLEAPSSAVDALPVEVFDTSFTVSWSGTDAHAGVMDYDIYVIEDDTLHYIWKNGIRKTSATFTGSYGRTYKFYSVARDNAGNEELPPFDPVMTPDAVTTLKPTGIHRPAPGEVAANLYPNPATQSVHVEVELLQREALAIRISHLHGTLVDERLLGPVAPGLHRVNFNLAHYAAGVYLVEVRAGERQRVLKLVVQQ